MGKNYDEIGKAISGLRVGQHIFFYRLTPSRDVEIIRILQQRMDLKNKLDE